MRPPTRLTLVVLGLALFFAVLTALVSLYHEELGLPHDREAQALVHAGLVILLTVAGAVVIRAALRPMERDIRRSHLEAVRASRKLDAVIQTAPVAIFTVDADGRVGELWNPAAERMFGWTQDEVMGQPLPIIPPGQEAGFAEHLRRALEGRPVLGKEVVRRRKDGSPIEVVVSNAVLPAHEGVPLRILALITDLSEQVEARRQLQLRSSIIEHLADPVIAYDARYEVTYWNQAAELLYGWTAEEMLGTYANTRLNLEPVGTTLQAAREQMLRDGVFQGEFVQRRKDGSTIRVESRITVRRDADGKVIGCITSNRDLTERRQLEAALRETQEQIRRIGENVPDIIFRYRLVPTRGYDYISPAVTAISGYTPEEIMADPEAGLGQLHPEDRGRVEALMAAPDTVTGEPIVLRFYHRDGHLYYTESRHTAVRDAEGRVVALEWVARDITEQVQIERQLRESEARFRRLIDNAPDIIYRYRLHPDRGFDYVSPAVEAISGYSREEFYQNPSMPLRLLPVEAHGVIDALVSRPEELDGRPIQLAWQRKDGSTAWVEQRNVLVRDDDGRVVAIEGIARDFTERKELEERYARLSQVVEQAAELVLITDVEGTLVYVNPAFERLTGYTAAEALGQTPRVLKSGRQTPELYRDLWMALGRGESWVGRLWNRRKDGSLYLADVLISPVRDRAGQVVNYVGIQRDVTRESELDEQLRQAQKMEAVGQLTGGIAHDFNNLLTVIMANITLVQDALPDAPGDVPHYLQDIQAAARRGADMVRKLLAFGRQERLQPQPADIHHLVGEFLHTVGRILPAMIEIHATSEADLPPARVDRGALEQILLNLATNSRDAMPAGGRIEVRIGTAEFDAEGERTVSGWREPGRFVHLSFRDTGGGMPADHLDRIFEPFFTTKPTGKGSGLGMPMVYGLMKQHHGFVTVSSAVDQGTTVDLYFPVAESQAAAGTERRDASSTIPGGGETILLVEDEEPIRRVATLILERLGYTVVTARDGVEALEVFEAVGAGVDLILSDVVMPRLNGPDLVAQLRERGHHVRVLFATGYASADVLRGLNLPGEALFIEKPWTVEVLARRVREALGGAAPGSRP